jgi:integrase
MASTREREGKFTGLYRDRAGHQRSAGTYTTKREALKAARHAEALEAQGRDAANAMREPKYAYSIERRGHITIAGNGPAWLAGHRLEPSSRETYARSLEHLYAGLGTKTLRELSPQDVRQFFRSLEASGMSPGTESLVMTVLREMCRTAVQDGLMDRDVTAGIKIAAQRPREMTIASPVQARAIRKAISEPYKLLVETLFATGMRYGEAMGLKPEDIELNHASATIQVRRAFVEVSAKPMLRDHGKTPRAIRSITIEIDLARRLVENAREGFVFRAPRGGYLFRTHFRRVWKPAVKAAGLPMLRVHDARHSHISWLANDPSVPLAAVRDRAGHSTLAITSRYIHVMDKEIDPCLVALRAAA